MTATSAGPDPARGVYAISVAAELVGMGDQTLRLYEQRGLLEPARSGGGTRRYSSDDLERLRRIGDLVAAGVNLAGVAMVLDLQDANALLQSDLDTVRQPSPDSPQTASTPHARKRPDKHVKRR